MERPINHLMAGLFTFYVEGMRNATMPINHRLYQNITNWVEFAEDHITYTALDHVGTRHAHMFSLLQIGVGLQQANMTLQTVTDQHTRHTSSENDLADLKLRVKLKEAESKLVRLLSSRRSPIQEQDGTALRQAEAHVATALDSIERFAQDDADHTIDTTNGWWRKRTGSIPLPGLSPNEKQDEHQLQKNAAKAQMEGTYQAGKKLLARMQDWKSLDTQINAEWDKIEARIQEHTQHANSLNVEIAVQNLWDICQDSLGNLAEEIEVFMKTWGPGAGFRWKKYKSKGKMSDRAGAVPCRDRDSTSTEVDTSWWKSDAA